MSGQSRLNKHVTQKKSFCRLRSLAFQNKKMEKPERNNELHGNSF